MAFSSRQFWAVLSAAFAALTAIFAKVGVENVNSDFATLIRTVVILLVLAGLATGASWLCYFRALKLWAGGAGGAHRQAKRRAGGDLRRPFFGRAPVRDELAWRRPYRGGRRAGGLPGVKPRPRGHPAFPGGS